MITETTDGILAGIQPYTIILNQANCLGKMDTPFSIRLYRTFPGLYQEFRNYCGLFQEDYNGKSHRDEILGTFFHFNNDEDKIIICNAFAQEHVSNTECLTEPWAWRMILPKLEKQVRVRNKHMLEDWKIHCQEKIGCHGEGGDWEQMRSLIEDHFANSPVEFVIHMR